jgi:hypothetical protein
MSTQDQRVSEETSLEQASFGQAAFDRATSDDVVFADRVAAAARLLAVEPSVQETLDGIVELAVSMVPGCAAAGISLIHGRRDRPGRPPRRRDAVRARRRSLPRRREVGGGRAL